MKLELPLCLFNRHAPKRHRVKWDGLHFVGTCRFCHKPVRRMEKGHWVKDWMETEAPAKSAEN